MPIEYVNSYRGYAVGQEVEFIHPDRDDERWIPGIITALDSNEVYQTPFEVVGTHEDDYSVWVKVGAIRPLNSAKPTQLEYREFYSHGWTQWQPLSIEGNDTFGGCGGEDYEIEIRVKQDFVPGWYQYIGSDASEHESFVWLEIPLKGDRDEWRRVNLHVTDAE